LKKIKFLSNVVKEMYLANSEEHKHVGGSNWVVWG